MPMSGVATSISGVSVSATQAQNLIDFHNIMRLPGSKGLTDVEWNEREKYWRISRELNRRGIKA
mgnify:CR=1 FL=1